MPRDVIVPPNGEVDRLLESEPGINDEIERQQTKAAILDGVSVYTNCGRSTAKPESSFDANGAGSIWYRSFPKIDVPE